MKPPHSKENEHLLSLSDFFEVFKRRKKLIALWIIGGAFLACGYQITKPSTYTAEALFKERQSKNSGSVNSLFSAFTSGNFGAEAEAISMIKSRKVMDRVAKQLHLQGSLVEKGVGKSKTGIAIDNLRLEYAHYKQRSTPLFPVNEPCIACEEIEYNEEIPTSLEIVFNSKNTFQVYEGGGNWIGKGKLDTPFVSNRYRFILRKNGEDRNTGKHYYLSLQPLLTVSKSLAASVSIEPDKKIKHLLEIRYKHPNRNMAKKIVNAIMESYEQSIADDYQKFANNQLAYLNQRKSETFNDLVDVMNLHADTLTNEINNYGFLDTESETRFLVGEQLEALKKQNLITLEAQRIETFLGSGNLPLADLATQQNPSILQGIEKMRDLKQQRDSLSLMLHEKRKLEDKDTTQPFHYIQHELDSIAVTREEVKQLINHLETGEPLNQDLAILHDTSQYIGSWYQQSQFFQKDAHTSSFVSYLNNLVKMYDVYANILQERLTHEFPIDSEYQGIDLETATRIYLANINELNQLEAEQRHYRFALEQIEDPEFELSSLSTTIQDPISKEVITKASNLAYTLKDEANRSPKEQDRIKKELLHHREYLQSHLKQTESVAGIKQEILKEKSTSLQGLMLEMINEKITILEKSLRENLMGMLNQLTNEQQLIDKHLTKISQEMLRLPKKWVSEQMVKQNIAMAKATVEELTRLVEGKNIAHNLDTVTSSAVDKAVVPILPNRPNLIFFTILGGILGAFIGSAILVLESIYKGIPATKENLEQLGYSVCGTLSSRAGKEFPPIDEDIDTLRRLSSWVGNSRHLLIITGEGPDFSPLLAELFSKRGEKTLILPASFKTSCQKEGLLQFLEGKIPSPPIQHHKGWDSIESGGISRFGTELVTSSSYQKLIENLTHHYDRIIAVAEALPCSSEAESLMNHFETAIISLNGESVQKIINNNNNKVLICFYCK